MWDTDFKNKKAFVQNFIVTQCHSGETEIIKKSKPKFHEKWNPAHFLYVNCCNVKNIWDQAQVKTSVNIQSEQVLLENIE